MSSEIKAKKSSNDYGARCYLSAPPEIIREIHEEAKRLNRSVSWVVQRSWIIFKRMAKDNVQK